MSGTPAGRKTHPQWQVVALIAVGGVIGAELRYATAELLPASTFPWATLLVNVVAGLGIGLLMAYIRRYEMPAPLLRPFVGVGVLGGLSTFSTYSTDTFRLIDTGHALVALSYATLTLVAALGATLIGTFLVAHFLPD